MTSRDNWASETYTKPNKTVFDDSRGGLGFSATGSGLRLTGSGLRMNGSCFRTTGSYFRTAGSGFRVNGFVFETNDPKACVLVLCGTNFCIDGIC
jgi:hypothetical protein